MQITLNEQQMSNLQTFLNRVDLKGNEVGAFVEIMQVLNRPREEKEILGGE